MNITKQFRGRIDSKKDEEAVIKAKEEQKHKKFLERETAAINRRFKVLKDKVRLLVTRLTFLEDCLIDCSETPEFQDFLKRKFEKSSEYFNMAKFGTTEGHVFVLAPGDQEVGLAIRCWYAKETMKFGLGKLNSKPSRLDFLCVHRPFSKYLLYGNEIFIPAYKEILSQKNVRGGYSHHTDLELKAIDAQVSESLKLIGKMETGEDFFEFLKKKVGFKLI